MVSVLRPIGLAVLVIALGACGESAAPVNVEGTVQARVSATVGAAQRIQPTPTRPLAGTTVIPFGTPATPGTPGTAVATGSAAPGGTGTPGATVSPGASGTASGTGTPLRTSTPGGTTTVLAAGTPGTALAGTASPVASPATPPPPLVLGAFARFGGFSATITRYEWNTACPGGAGRAATGAKFVLLQGVGRNDGSGALSPPSLIWAIESAPAGASLPCRPEGRSFDEACYRDGLLPAGARCEGWLLFEVPEALEVPGSLVTARVAGPLVTPGPTTQDVGRWRLPS